MVPAGWQAQGTERRPQKPYSTEGVRGVLREVQHTNLSSAHTPHGIEGRPGGLESHDMQNLPAHRHTPRDTEGGLEALK